MTQAHSALSDWQAADTDEQIAGAKERAAGPFKRRRPATEHDTAQSAAQDPKRHLTKAWGGTPPWGRESGQAARVERVTQARVDADPRVVEAGRQRADTAHALLSVMEPNTWPSIGVYARIFDYDAMRKTRCLRQRPPRSAGRCRDPHDAAGARRRRGAASPNLGRGDRTDRADPRSRGSPPRDRPHARGTRTPAPRLPLVPPRSMRWRVRLDPVKSSGSRRFQRARINLRKV